MKFDKKSTKKIAYFTLVFLVFFVLLATRRWQQLSLPQVWDEDGTVVLFGFINHGLSSFLEQATGYLITISRIISFISLKLSFLYYPLISTIITWLFIALVGCAITFCPTKLYGKFFCALAVFVVPSDPEVFGLPSYVFWWSSLLLFLVAFWDEKKISLGWRILFLVIGGLSSPIILLILPILYFRAYLYRTMRSEKIIAIIATIIFAIQIFFISKTTTGHFWQTFTIPHKFISVFFGRFLIGNITDNASYLLIAGLVVIFISLLFFYDKYKKWTTWALFYLLAGSILLVAARINADFIHPRLVGPRYFFFTFIIISWILIQLFYNTNRIWLKCIIGIIFAIAFINAIPVWSRQHDDLRWADHVLSCQLFPKYYIPIEYDGNGATPWFLEISGKNCSKLLSQDLILLQEKRYVKPTFAYTLHKINKIKSKQKKTKIISKTMTGSDYQKSKIKGYKIIGSYINPDAGTGEINLKLRRGNKIFYRSGNRGSNQSISIEGHEDKFIRDLPIALDWTVLDFSNSKLPKEFIIKIKDDGQERDEWSAIAIKK